MSAAREIHGLMPADAWHNYVDSWCNGWAAGIEEGRRREREELAAIQRAAVRSVRAAVTLPERDAAADHAAARRRAARWSK